MSNVIVCFQYPRMDTIANGAVDRSLPHIGPETCQMSCGHSSPIPSMVFKSIDPAFSG